MQVKGKAEPLALYRPLARPRPLRLGRDPHARDAARRPGAREAAPDRHLRALGAAALLPARHDRGRAGRRQEPALRGALRLHRGSPRARPLAAGTLSSLRGGDRLLGARGDRQGGVRHPRVGLARGGGGQARATPCPPTSPTAPGSWPASPRSSAPAASPPPRRSPSPPGGASSSRWRRARETVLVFEDLHWADEALLSFLEHLADWSQGVPLLLSARPARSCTSSIRLGRPACANATTINLAPLTDEETARLLVVAPRAGGLASGDAAGAARAGGWQPPVRGGVRAPARRPRPALGDARGCPVARLGAGADRRAAGHALAGAKEPAPGRVRHGQASSGRVRVAEMGDRDPREVELALHELARKELVRPARTSSMEGEREYGFWHLLVRDVCYGQIPRAARAARHRAAADLARAQGGRAGRGPRRRARLPLPDRARARRRRRRRRAGAGARGERDPLPGPGRRARARTRRRERRGEPRPGARARPRRASRARAPCSSAGRRRRSSRAGCRRQRTRSRRRSPSTASGTSASPPGAC